MNTRAVIFIITVAPHGSIADAAASAIPAQEARWHMNRATQSRDVYSGIGRPIWLRILSCLQHCQQDDRRTWYAQRRTVSQHGVAEQQHVVSAGSWVCGHATRRVLQHCRKLVADFRVRRVRQPLPHLCSLISIVDTTNHPRNQGKQLQHSSHPASNI